MGCGCGRSKEQKTSQDVAAEEAARQAQRDAELEAIQASAGPVANAERTTVG